MAAELVVLGARVYTVNREEPWAEAFAVEGGRITAVGSDAEVRALVGSATEVRELGGTFVMPGLVDVHNHHYFSGKEELFELQLPIGASLDTIIDSVRSYAAQLPEGAWIAGAPIASDRLAECDTADALALLDEAAAGRPVALLEDSHHNRWANSLAMRLGGVEAGQPGVSVDAEGRLTGVLYEAAGIPVAQAQEGAGGLTPEQVRMAAHRGIEILNSFGVTAFQDAGVSTPVLEALRSLDDEGKLNAWAVTSMLINDIFGFKVIGEDLVFTGEAYRTEHHRPDFVKIYLDGVPPTRTAAFLEPYLPDQAHGSHFCGETLLPAEELTDWLRRMAEIGISAKVHCTGDASVRAVLDAVEILRAEGFDKTRYQVAHTDFVHDDDFSRFALLDVSADISPFLWVPGPIPAAIAEVLPPERAGRIHPNRILVDAGANVAGGSDWPVSPSPNPWEGIHGLVTRQDPSGKYPGTLWAEQALTLEESLEVFTINGARAMGLDEETGSIEVGKSADFVMLDRDPFAHPANQLVHTRTLETWFEGRQVFAV